MSNQNIDTKALEEAINEVKDARFQKELREWLVYSAPKEVVDIWKRYVEKAEANEERTARLREEYVKDQQSMTVWLRVISMSVMVAAISFCSYQIYEAVTFTVGCAR